MIKKWVRFILFWVFFALLFSLLNLSVVGENQRLADFYKLPRNSVDVIFMGNSHGFYSFQPKIVNDILSTNSYIIGIGSENIVLSYYELKEVLKYQHPKAVVLETFALDLGDTDLELPYYYEFLDTGVWDTNKTAVASRYLTLETLYTIFPALRTRFEWDKPYVYLRQMTEKIRNIFSPSIDSQLGAAPKTEVISESAYESALNKVTTQEATPSKDTLMYLGKFLQLCKENNIQLILVKSPSLSGPSAKIARYAPFDVQKFAYANDIPLITFSDENLDHLHFRDSGHINTFGSVIVSADLAVKLSPILGAPIDQNELSYYQSFAFFDYEINQNGNENTICLQPDDLDPDLEYKWSISNGSVVVDETSWQTNSFYKFDLDQTGTYTITVEIKNLDGDYEFSAAFQINK